MIPRKRKLPLPNFDRPILTQSEEKRHPSQPPPGPDTDKKEAPAVDVAKKKDPLPPQERQRSRIAATLPNRRYFQQDPSVPTYYTRKETRIMNDETPDRGEEETPPFFRQQLVEERKEASPSLDFQQSSHSQHFSPLALFTGQKEEDGHRGHLFTQEYSDPFHHHQDSQSQSSPAPAESPDKSQTKRVAAGNNAPKKPPPAGALESTASDTKDRSQKSSRNQDTGTNDEPTNKAVQSQDSKPQAAAQPEEFRLFFVERGRDMHRDILVGPKMNARARGATVLEKFDPHTRDPLKIPTHLVVGTVSGPEVVSGALGFNSVQDLRHYMHEHNIQCATRDWATKTTGPYRQPRRTHVLRQLGIPYQELYLQLTPQAPPRPTKPAAKPSSRGVDSRQASANTDQQRSSYVHNVELSKIFKRLCKAYQEAPLDPIDAWRAYSFATAASRLQGLPFEVDNQEALNKVKKIKGFGTSTVEIIEEYLQQKEELDDEDAVNDDSEGGITIQRLEHLKTDPTRQVLRTMMNIWGVGRVRALELIKAGYTTVDEIRKDFYQDRLRVSLDRNQYIGLLCYDDFLEEMDRAEVESIAAIIRKTVRETYADAEIEIMGSYRRGHEFCGDIDVLIVHKKYQKTVNPKALGRVIDRLRIRGHIAYNLTQLAGMDTEAFETLPRDVASRFSRSSILSPKKGSDGCSSYMGVFKSPVHPGKMRRCDIKWYPYRERCFASLYFTGNGFFNRSMRLWARRTRGYTLSDHGLFQDSSDRVRVFDAMSEKMIFKRLELVWRGPTEREGFDAVIGLNSKRATDLEEWSKSEFNQEERGHVWIE